MMRAMFEITMNGPGKNALGTQMMDFLLGQLREAGGVPVLLTGTGNAFSAGLNLREVASLDTPGMQTFLNKLEELVQTLFHYPGPTVAAVNGHAIAGGCVLTQCCDHRVMTTNGKSKIGLNEVAIGLRFPPGVFTVCRSRVPRRSHEAVFLSAGLHDPPAALELGLIDRLADDPVAAGRKVLSWLGTHPAAAYAATKADLRDELRLDPADRDRFVAEVLPMWTSDDLKQRLLKLLQR